MGERPFVPDFEKEQEVVRLQQLLEDIKNGSFARVYLLYGEETYLRLQYRDKLKKALIPDGDTMNYHYFEGKGVETAQLIDLAETLPFFAERRVIVVENSGLFKKATEDLAEYFKAPAPSVCFVFVETEVDKRGRLYRAVRDTGRVVEFARQNEATLQKWILIQLKKEGKRITQNDLQFFQQRVGSDMENISRELEKLFCYDTFKEDYKVLNTEVRKLGYNIPPLVNAYMSLSPTMRMFGTAINDGFGDVEETGILIAVDEILEEKRIRHIESYIKEHPEALQLTSGANPILSKN